MELTSTLRLFQGGTPPALPPKTRIGGGGRSTTLTSLNAFNRIIPTIDTQQASGDFNTNNKTTTTTTVFVCNPSTNDETSTFSSLPNPDNHENSSGGHVVKIRINPNNTSPPKTKSISTIQLTVQQEEPLHARDDNGGDVKTSIADSHRETVDEDVENSSNQCVRICVAQDDPKNIEMMKNSTLQTENFTKPVSMAIRNNSNNTPYFFYNGFQCSPPATLMSSGQCSPSDTLDSGTCSDLDCTPPPPPLPKKKNQKTLNTSEDEEVDEEKNVSVRLVAKNLTHRRKYDDSDDNESNISCDSLNSSELNGSAKSDEGVRILMPLVSESSQSMPQGLLQDIRNGTARLTGFEAPPSSKPLVDQSTYEERHMQEKPTNPIKTELTNKYLYENDRYYKFHLNETVRDDSSDNSVSVDGDGVTPKKRPTDEDESFAGFKDLLDGQVPATIRSAKGTIRGVKNRVRAGIATFLQIHSTTKNYREKDAGKVVVYTTTMGIVRATYHQCVKVKQILRTHLVKFEERDVFMSNDYQSEIRDRMQSDQILIPQVFVDGQHVGNAETIERLNECGELRRILKPYKSADACSTCQVCGGYRLLPCPVCNGSKKSVHRNHFTTEFVALKCMNCDEVGLVRCYACSS